MIKRADVRQLATLPTQLARGATRIELRDTRSATLIASWAPTGDAAALAQAITDLWTLELYRLDGLGDSYNLDAAECGQHPLVSVEALLGGVRERARQIHSGGSDLCMRLMSAEVEILDRALGYHTQRLYSTESAGTRTAFTNFNPRNFNPRSEVS